MTLTLARAARRPRQCRHSRLGSDAAEETCDDAAEGAAHLRILPRRPLRPAARSSRPISASRSASLAANT